MKEFIQSIFQGAVFKEQAARKLYVNLSNRTTNDLIKQLFLRLAAEESVHENLFKKMRPDILNIVNKAPLENLNLLNNLTSTELIDYDKEEINNALDYAITQEQNAINDYSILINHLDFGENREAIQEIVNQETRHKNLLQKTKLEFNDNDWKKL
ncbi:MAG: ferritin family protein [Candidatus Woesearchaeota archaeon]